MTTIITLKLLAAAALAALCFILGYKSLSTHSGAVNATLPGMTVRTRLPGVVYILVGLGILGYLFIRPITSIVQTEEEIKNTDGTITRRWHEEQMAGAARQAPLPKRAPRK